MMQRRVAGITVLNALVVVCMWLIDAELLLSLTPDSIAMRFNLALGFLISGLIMWFYSNRVIRQSLAWLLVVLSALTIAEYWFGLNLGIDTLFVQPLDGMPYVKHPGRMAESAAVAMLALGLGRVVENFMLERICLLTPIMCAFVSLLPYLGVVPFVADPMASHAAFLFIFHSIGCLVSQKSHK